MSYQDSSYCGQHKNWKNYDKVISIISLITERQAKSRLEETKEEV